jgi:hypothetical protein
LIPKQQIAEERQKQKAKSREEQSFEMISQM